MTSSPVSVLGNTEHYLLLWWTQCQNGRRLNRRLVRSMWWMGGYPFNGITSRNNIGHRSAADSLAGGGHQLWSITWDLWDHINEALHHLGIIEHKYWKAQSMIKFSNSMLWGVHPCLAMPCICYRLHWTSSSPNLSWQTDVGGIHQNSYSLESPWWP